MNTNRPEVRLLRKVMQIDSTRITLQGTHGNCKIGVCQKCKSVLLAVGSGVAHSLFSTEDIVLQNAVYCTEPISPTDFLSFFIGASVVGNTYFVDADFRNT